VRTVLFGQNLRHSIQFRLPHGKARALSPERRMTSWRDMSRLRNFDTRVSITFIPVPFTFAFNRPAGLEISAARVAVFQARRYL
jgi:hypothetical protein